MSSSKKKVMMSREEKKRVTAMFKAADTDHSGTIDLDELQVLLKCVDVCCRLLRSHCVFVCLCARASRMVCLVGGACLLTVGAYVVL